MTSWIVRKVIALKINVFFLTPPFTFFKTLDRCYTPLYKKDKKENQNKLMETAAFGCRAHPKAGLTIFGGPFLDIF